MKKHLTFIILGLFCYPVFSQQVFTYSREKKEIRLRNDSSSILFVDYVKKPEETRERIVNCNGTTYRFLIRKVNGKRVQEILDETGEKKAAVLMTSKDTWDILLLDGTQLKWSGISDRKWSFSLAGKKIISGKLQKANREKQLVITTHESSYPIEILQLIALERGTDKIISSASTPFLIVAAVTFLAMQTAAGN